MDSFNLKKFINENNLGAYSRLKETELDEQSAFVLAADAARDAGKDEFEFPKGSGKMHKVTIKKDIPVEEEAVNEVSPDIMDSLDSIIMGGLAALGAIKLAPKLIDLLGDPETGEITHDSLKRAKDRLMKEEASAEEEDQFHTQLDKLVHKTFGASSDEKPEKKSQFKKAGERAGFDMRGIREEVDKDSYDSIMGPLQKQAFLMNKYVGEFGNPEERKRWRAVYFALEDFDDYMSYGKPDGALEEDIDVGHQDDEPAMLKNTTYRAAKLAGMLYKKLDKYDNFPTEVDFPNWWQTKVTKAKDMLQAAYDYLDGEEGVAQVDAVTHEEVEEMKHPQYGTASNKYASRANKPGKFGNSPELNKTLGDTAAKAMDILKRKGLAEDNIKLSDIL